MKPKRSLSIGMTLCGAIALVCGLLLLLKPQPVQALPPPTRYVDLAGTCGGYSPCYTTIQAAVDAASSNDIIKVAAGVYSGTLPRPIPSGYPYPPATGYVVQTVYISKTLTLKGGYTTSYTDPSNPSANPTLIDPGGLGRAMLIAGDISPVVQGFQITNGDAIGMGGSWHNGDAGGGIFVLSASTTISDNDVISNTASKAGGGIFLKSATNTILFSNNIKLNNANTGGGIGIETSYYVTVSGNIIQNNSTGLIAQGHGGGLYSDYSYYLTLLDNTFQENNAGQNYSGGGGGAKFNFSNYAMVDGNTFQDNTGSTVGDGIGGGLYIQNSENVRLTNNDIINNAASSSPTSGAGGGLYFYNSDNLTMNRNRIKGSVASFNDDGYGGGIYLEDCDDASLDGNTIISNTTTQDLTAAAGQGGGIFAVSSSLTLTNNIIADNFAHTQGSGIWSHAYSTVAMQHNTLAGNLGIGQGIYVGGFVSMDLKNNIIGGQSIGIYNDFPGYSFVTATHTLFYSNTLNFTGGVNSSDQTEQYPEFIDPAAWDYHLRSSSPAIDAGMWTGLAADIDGDYRPDNCKYDIGADEYVFNHPCKTSYLPLLCR